MFNHSSDIGFQYFMNLYKKCTAKSYSCLVIDTVTVASDIFYVSERILKKKNIKVSHGN